MVRPYSLDLRDRVVAAVAGCQLQRTTSAHHAYRHRRDAHDPRRQRLDRQSQAAQGAAPSRSLLVADQQHHVEGLLHQTGHEQGTGIAEDQAMTLLDLRRRQPTAGNLRERLVISRSMLRWPPARRPICCKNAGW